MVPSNSHLSSPPRTGRRIKGQSGQIVWGDFFLQNPLSEFEFGSATLVKLPRLPQTCTNLLRHPSTPLLIRQVPQDPMIAMYWVVGLGQHAMKNFYFFPYINNYIFGGEGKQRWNLWTIHRPFTLHPFSTAKERP